MPLRVRTTGDTGAAFRLRVSTLLTASFLVLGQAAWAGSAKTSSVENQAAINQVLPNSQFLPDNQELAGQDQAAKRELAGSIDNFDIVSRGVWRGAAPSEAALDNLAAHGVKTIVDLRMTGLGTFEEGSQARKLGINYVHIPLGYRGPTMTKLAQFLNLVENPDAQPVYVHCRYGADRTGTLIGCFRVMHDHWSFDQAYSEMRSHHFKPWFTGMKKLVARVEADPQTRKTLMVLTEQDFSHRRMAVKASPRG